MLDRFHGLRLHFQPNENTERPFCTMETMDVVYPALKNDIFTFLYSRYDKLQVLFARQDSG